MEDDIFQMAEPWAHISWAFKSLLYNGMLLCTGGWFWIFLRRKQLDLVRRLKSLLQIYKNNCNKNCAPPKNIDLFVLKILSNNEFMYKPGMKKTIQLYWFFLYAGVAFGHRWILLYNLKITTNGETTVALEIFLPCLYIVQKN